MEGGLPRGAYDQLFTEGLAAVLEGIEAETGAVDPAELSEVLASHLETVAQQALNALPPDRRLAVANAM